MNDLYTIGNIIRNIRLESGYKTQEKFAELVDISKDTVSNIERGETLMSATTLVKISEACNVSADYILGTGPNK